MSQNEIVALVGLVVFLVCLISNMVSVGVKFRAPRAADPAHHVEAREGGIDWNPWHFIIVFLMLIAWTVVLKETTYLSKLYDTVRGAATPAPSEDEAESPITGTLPNPDPADFVSAPGSTEIEAKNVPAGQVVVVKFDSVKAKQQGVIATNGQVLGGTGKYPIPDDARNLDVKYWDQTQSLSSGFVRLR